MAIRLLNQLERKMHGVRIQPFFKYIIFAMAGVALLQFFIPRYPLVYWMALVRDLVFSGQIWRLLTFLLIPPLMEGSILTTSGIIQVALMLYFYYFIGTALEGRWGARRFLLYYAIGALAAILAGLISGIGFNQFLYLSMFFAFAIQYPDFQLLLFFVLPIKVKWLALFNAVYHIYLFAIGTWPVRLAILFSLLNLVLFFGGDLLTMARQSIAQWRRRQLFKKNTRR